MTFGLLIYQFKDGALTVGPVGALLLFVVFFTFIGFKARDRK